LVVELVVEPVETLSRHVFLGKGFGKNTNHPFFSKRFGQHIKIVFFQQATWCK
jgi:hypothetical protein